jgi:UDP-2-acetamido-3-amino-2,3-dideoxy-glucuronate N-acetyltransferase
MKKSKFKVYDSATGSLLPITFKKDIPFNPKRIFIINGKKGTKRADHAHHKCSQYLIPIYGLINVNYENKKGKFKKKLSFNNCEGLLLKPNTWVNIKFVSKNSKLLVFCDRDYEYSDYIEHYDIFLKIIGRYK